MRTLPSRCVGRQCLRGGKWRHHFNVNVTAENSDISMAPQINRGWDTCIGFSVKEVAAEAVFKIVFYFENLGVANNA